MMMKKLTFLSSASSSLPSLGVLMMMKNLALTTSANSLTLLGEPDLVGLTYLRPVNSTSSLRLSLVMMLPTPRGLVFSWRSAG